LVVLVLDFLHSWPNVAMLSPDPSFQPFSLSPLYPIITCVARKSTTRTTIEVHKADNNFVGHPAGRTLKKPDVRVFRVEPPEDRSAMGYRRG
jgi:hypothetical protein